MTLATPNAAAPPAPLTAPRAILTTLLLNLGVTTLLLGLLLPMPLVDRVVAIFWATLYMMGARSVWTTRESATDRPVLSWARDLPFMLRDPPAAIAWGMLIISILLGGFGLIYSTMRGAAYAFGYISRPGPDLLLMTLIDTALLALGIIFFALHRDAARNTAGGMPGG